MQEEVRATENKAFKSFCKRAKVKNVTNFEALLFSRPETRLDGASGTEGGIATRELTPEQLNAIPLPESESALISCKFDFENAISKCQANLKFNEQ